MPNSIEYFSKQLGLNAVRLDNKFCKYSLQALVNSFDCKTFQGLHLHGMYVALMVLKYTETIL